MAEVHGPGPITLAGGDWCGRYGINLSGMGGGYDTTALTHPVIVTKVGTAARPEQMAKLDTGAVDQVSLCGDSSLCSFHVQDRKS